MEKRRIERGRGWIITVQAPVGSGDEWRVKTPCEWNDSVTYKGICYEKGVEAASIHCHLLMNFKNSRRSNALAKELIGLNPKCEIDIQTIKGKWSDARKYILKQDRTKIKNRPPVEYGEIPRDRKKKEVEEENVKELVEIIKENGLKGALEEHSLDLLKHPTGCRLINELVEKESRKRTVKVTIIWGDAGTGKSTWAAQEARRDWGDDVYFYTKVGGSRETIWFNGYRDQKCVIMDDISGRTVPYEYIIKITGNDPLDVEIKGGRVPARWEEVWITSNYNPRLWYQRIWEENGESKEAFFRRISRIIHVYKDEDGIPVWEVEKEAEVKIMKDDFIIEPSWKKTPTWIRERRRGENESERMKIEDRNVLHYVKSDGASNNNEEETEKSEIGLGVEIEPVPGHQPDTPGMGMYWGGGDTMYLNYGPIKRGRLDQEMKKKAAFSEFARRYNIRRRAGGAEPLSEEAISDAVRDGRLPYDEKTWMFLIEKEEEIRRSHYISEEEWSPESGYHDARHDSEVEDLYDIVNNWSERNEEQSFKTQWWEKERIEEIE